jgi:hypothetical protein
MGLCMGRLCIGRLYMRMPPNIKKEFDDMHNNTIRQIWDNMYNEIYIMGQMMDYDSHSERIIKFPLIRHYYIDQWSKKYSYKELDFMFYKLYLGKQKYIYYNSKHFIIDFYSDNNIGYIEIKEEFS